MTRLRILRADPVEEIAAHPGTVSIVRRLLLQARTTTAAAPVTSAVLGRLWPGAPLVGDGTLPPDEIHLRPTTRPSPTPGPPG